MTNDISAVPTTPGVYLDAEGQAWQLDESGWWGAGPSA
jgi:hypothetical protein